MVHSSMRAIGTVDEGAQGVIDVLLQSVSDGLLLFPTHSWREWNNPENVFDVANEPSCVGILPELFRKRSGVIRSWHPTHSIAGYGKDAAGFLAGEELTRTPCPRDGCWGRLYDRDAKILFLGAPLRTNTFLHSVEEWHEISDRLAETPTVFTILTPEGERISCPQYRHHSSLGDVSRFYDKIEPILFSEGIAVEGSVGDARCVCMSARKLADRVGAILEKRPQLFNDRTPLDAPVNKDGTVDPI